MGTLREVNLVSIALRILMALAIGGILGMERGRKNRPAGFRTYMLVCLGSTMVMMTNQYVYQTFPSTDPVRMGAQVISGIGFLGAGTIIITGKNQIKGMTTAAGLWTAACCGLAIGIGFYEGAILGGVTIYLIMTAFQRVDDKIRKHSRILELYIEFEGKSDFSEFLSYVRDNSIEIYDVQIQKNKLLKESRTTVFLTAKSQTKSSNSDLLEVLSHAPGVQYLEELNNS